MVLKLKKRSGVSPKKLGGKKITAFRPMVLTRHPSHKPLRTQLPRLPFRSVIRLGSQTVLSDDATRVQINTPSAVRNSASKLLMKQCFDKAGVKTAQWITGTNRTNAGVVNWAADKYPIIVKHVNGSRGTGNYFINNETELNAWFSGKLINKYIFEKYHTFNREYRLHVTKDGCFYTCRKMLKNGTPEEKKFQRHDDNCVWIMETNPQFQKPVNWEIIVEDCVKALKSLGLDICCFDVKIQSAKDKKGNTRPNPDYIIIESGSAPSFGQVTLQKYLQVLPGLIKAKHSEQRRN